MASTGTGTELVQALMSEHVLFGDEDLLSLLFSCTIVSI